MVQSSGRQVPGVIPLDKVGSVMGKKIPGGLPGHGRPQQPDFNIGDLRESRWYKDFHARFHDTKILSIEDMVKQIMFFAELEFYLNTIATSFLPRIVSVSPTTTRLTQKARYPKAYIFLNPEEVSIGVTTTFTFYASALRANGFNTPSPAVNVSATDRVSLFIDTTAASGTPTLDVAQESEDPLSLNFALVASDIFSGDGAGVTTAISDIGQLGVNRSLRLVATVGNAGGDDITFSISAVLKGMSPSSVGSTIFIGDKDVNTTMGIRVLPGQERKFYLLPNVELFAVTTLATLNFMVWELQ